MRFNYTVIISTDEVTGICSHLASLAPCLLNLVPYAILKYCAYTEDILKHVNFRFWKNILIQIFHSQTENPLSDSCTP